MEDAERRLRDHPKGDVPDVARTKVINDAVEAFQAHGSWPSDLGKRAAKAYATGLEWESELLARELAVTSAELLAYDTRQAFSGDALGHLGTRLDAVLSDAREAGESLDGARTAGAAIKAGGAVVEAWGRLQGLVDDLTNVRSAQWELLLPRLRPGDTVANFDAERGTLRGWRSDGFGEVRGSLDDVPAFVREATRSGRYSETVLLWLASAGTAKVPTSFEDLQDDATAGSLPDAFAGADWVDYSPRVTQIPEPRPAQTYAHSSTPALDDTKPRPAPPKPNAVVSDREAVTVF
ncbi:hypothetical protein G3I62_27275 [Streptomyces sp. SID14446]|uniref:hypothetical protein n=1 Tax=Streptomyces sp. SID14446 TaxID=2706072 RepID=UPI0013B8A874|nr:hypothetical protein [Streptomyces sp. SID14446]NEB32751.1 hypothetical protein [Streptomyces sp. SID14446]